MDKKLKEITAAGGAGAAVQGAGGSFQVTRRGKVFPIDKKRGKTNGRPHAKKGAEGKLAMVAETEKALRETLRKIIFLNKVKFYEEKARVALQENKLRKVIRYLLKEEDDPILSRLNTTGQIFAYKAFKNTLTGIKNSYKDLISSKQQRESFKEVFYDGVAEYFDTIQKTGGVPKPAEKPEEKAVSEPVLPVPEAPPEQPAAPEEAGPLGEQEGDAGAEEASPETGATASPEDIKSQEAEQEKFRKQLAAQTVSKVQQIRKDVNVTGAKEAYDVLNTALPQLGAEYAKLEDGPDQQSFVDLLLGPNKDKAQSTIMSTIDAFEIELNNTNPKTREG